MSRLVNLVLDAAGDAANPGLETLKALFVYFCRGEQVRAPQSE